MPYLAFLLRLPLLHTYNLFALLVPESVRRWYVVELWFALRRCSFVLLSHLPSTSSAYFGTNCLVFLSPRHPIFYLLRTKT